MSDNIMGIPIVDVGALRAEVERLKRLLLFGCCGCEYYQARCNDKDCNKNKYLKFPKHRIKIHPDCPIIATMVEEEYYKELAKQ